MLLGNYSVLNKSPLRFFGGSTVSPQVGVRSNFNTSGSARNRFYVDQRTTALSLYSVPEGTYAGKAWLLPQKSGAISGQNSVFMTFGGVGSGALGKAAAGTGTVTFSLSGLGGLISSASGTCGIAFTASGGLFASKAASGTANIALSSTGAITGLGHTGGSAGTALACAWAPYAIGWLGGTTAESGLTPNGIANAVWQKVIEAGFTADQILRILAAQAAGAATGLEGSNPQFIGLDGTTTRIDGSYSAGTRTIDSLNGA